MKTLTVFTPSYNRAHTLVRTYESLCRQTSDDYEWMVIDDGSTDNTEEMVKEWIVDNKILIRYLKKENGGLYTGYNTAYMAISTELNVCIDSDDYMPDDAVESIVSFWRKYGSDKYAGMLGLDYFLTNEPIGGVFPVHLKEVFFYDLYLKKLHSGDTKPVYRSELTRKVAPLVGFEGEKNFNPVYMALQIDQDYPLLILNKNLCFVEYQQNDSMSASIFHQYFNSPKSFCKLRKLEMILKRNTWRNIMRVIVHYVATSIISGNKHFIKESPRPFLTFLLSPFGGGLYLYFKYKANK